MSRSYRSRHSFWKSSITCSGFNKGIHDDKKANNRLLRAKSKQLLKECQDYDSLSLPYRLEEVMNRWDYRDDGRWSMRKDEILERYSRPWHYLYK